jgi:hypothetical protein
MAIGERERKPCRLFTPSNENLLAGVDQFVIGGRHSIASSRGIKGFGRSGWHHTACCKAIETVNASPDGSAGPVEQSNCGELPTKVDLNASS